MDGIGFYIYIIIALMVNAAIGGAIGASRNNLAGGLLVGFFLGPIGWILAIFMDRRPQCGSCKGRIPNGAAVCLHCGASTGMAPAMPSGFENRPASSGKLIPGKHTPDPLADYKRWKQSQVNEPPMSDDPQ